MKPKYIDVKGIKTRYFEKGVGEPLVLVHGGQYGHYYNAYSWSLNWDGLSKHFRVYALDRLGMGYTDNPLRDSDYTIEATIRHIHDFMLALGLRRAHLAGHSRGGFLVTRVALEYQDIVSSLVIVDSGTLAPDDPSTPKDFYGRLERKAPAVETRESVKREPIANSYSKNHITEDFVEELYRIATLPKTSEARAKMKKLEHSLFLPRLDKMKRATLRLLSDGRLVMPTLTVWGLNDPSAPVKRGIRLFQILSAHLPRSQLHIFNRSGHYSFREYPADFNQIVSTFIRNC